MNYTNKDRETIIKATQSANLLHQDLQGLVSADHPLLGDYALDLLDALVVIEKKLQRLQGVMDVLQETHGDSHAH
ncbi:hypothetical protein HMI48_05490 [Acidithiobacillus ferrooxidans]|uniref:hypothetical protein n=1 Tax=Acidithiobacillus ferrooxidans TaxID=920 RepID=UPI001C0658F5|nr:hypothetical protein [Acidithiobacillus ferrooxidans]MBU2773376.1 hypothetical protein [Acidithiobacillus ferrooxidans]